MAAPPLEYHHRVISVVVSISDGKFSHAFSYIRCNEDPEYWMLADSYRDADVVAGGFVNTTLAFRQKGVFDPTGDGLLLCGRYSVRYGFIHANTQSTMLQECGIVYGMVQPAAHRPPWPHRIPRRDGETARAAILNHVFPECDAQGGTLKQIADRMGDAVKYSDNTDENFIRGAKASGKMCIEVPARLGEWHLMALVMHENDEWAVYDEDEDDDRPAFIFRCSSFEMFETKSCGRVSTGIFNITYHGNMLGLIGARCVYEDSSDIIWMRQNLTIEKCVDVPESMVAINHHDSKVSPSGTLYLSLTDGNSDYYAWNYDTCEKGARSLTFSKACAHHAKIVFSCEPAIMF